MNGVKFFLLLVLTIVGLILLLDFSETKRIWHEAALVAIVASIAAIIFSIYNRENPPK